MIAKIYCSVFLCAWFAFCDSAFVDTLHKCQPEDGDCLKKVIKGMLESIATTGIPEYDIPPIDPLKVTNFKFNFADVAELTVKEGVVKGLKGCEILDVKLNMNKGSGVLKLLCDITAKGKYEVSGSSPALKDLFGPGALKGNGNAKLKIEKLMVTYKVKFDVTERDGKIYINCKKEMSSYDFELQGPSHLTLDNLFIGDTDSSKIIMEYYNQNYKALWQTFGKTMMASVKEIAYEIIHKFFEKEEAKNYLAGDLSKYVKH